MLFLLRICSLFPVRVYNFQLLGFFLVFVLVLVLVSSLILKSRCLSSKFGRSFMNTKLLLREIHMITGETVGFSKVYGRMTLAVHNSIWPLFGCSFLVLVNLVHWVITNSLETESSEISSLLVS